MNTISYGDMIYMQLEIFQATSAHDALARNSEGMVVKISSDKELLFNDKVLVGYFVFLGTYTYETKQEILATVPEMMPLKDFQNKYLKTEQ